MLIQYFFITLVALLVDLIFVVLQLFGKLPFGLYDFIFLSILILALSLYRPRYMFGIFLATLPLENIILSPTELPISLRPFQLFGAILILATLILWLAKKLEFSLLSFRKICVLCGIHDKLTGKKDCCQNDEPQAVFGFFDRLVFIFPIFAVLAVYFSPDKAGSAKQALVLISFVALFWLARNYLQTPKDKFEGLWYFLVGSKVAILFGIYQAVAWKLGWPHLEVMPGRINSTFTEPDWLGMYLVFIIAITLWIKWYFLKTEPKSMVASFSVQAVVQWFCNLLLIGLIFALLLTVARSAWLALAGVIFLYLSILLLVPTDQQRAKRKFWLVSREAASLLVVIVISFGLIEYFSLSSFHLLNRAASSVSGLQKITVSCDGSVTPPEQIQNTNQLALYGCRHINLEEIEAEKQAGHNVLEIYRPDPNVQIRKNIYVSTWQQIKKHPIFGQGLGSATYFLGQDERGAGLNTSNIFLEVWLSMGIFALLILLSLLVLIPFITLWKVFKGDSQSVLLTFILLSAAAFFIPNMFNAGLLIGFFWIWLAVLAETGNRYLKR